VSCTDEPEEAAHGTRTRPEPERFRSPARKSRGRRVLRPDQAEWAWFARYYDAVTRPLRRLRHDVVDASGVLPGARVLDVATGTGAQALAFAGVASEVVGVDLPEAMLAIARRKNAPAHVAFMRADATCLPFPAGRFDVTCVSFALHEMPASVRDRVVREMARVTRHGGTIVVVDYALPAGRIASALALRLVSLYERPHYAEFVRSDLPALLEGIGIAVRADRRALLGNARIVVGDKVTCARHDHRHDCTRAGRRPGRRRDHRAACRHRDETALACAPSRSRRSAPVVGRTTAGTPDRSRCMRGVTRAREGNLIDHTLHYRSFGDRCREQSRPRPQDSINRPPAP